jgi:hypothetical protein
MYGDTRGFHDVRLRLERRSLASSHPHQPTPLSSGLRWRWHSKSSMLSLMARAHRSVGLQVSA